MLPSEEYHEGIVIGQAIVGLLHVPPYPGKTIEELEFATAFYQLIGRGLAQQGWFSGHPYEVRPGGLGGIEGELLDLTDGKASAARYVARIGETGGMVQ